MTPQVRGKPESAMFEGLSWQRIAVPFTGGQAGTEPVTWGQKAIWQDMQASGSQFSMPSMMGLPEGSTVEYATGLLSDVTGRYAALRSRLRTDSAGRLSQEVTGSGQTHLDIFTIPDDTDRADVARYARELYDTWPLTRFDFSIDWPLRMALLRHRGDCVYLVWILSHMVADGAALVLLLEDMIGRATDDPPGSQFSDVARAEQTPQLRQLSRRAMRYWESQLRPIPSLTFGEPAEQPGPRYHQVQFRSSAAHLAMTAIAKRTETDASRVLLALVATAIGRATGVHPLTFQVMINNRFRPGLADVMAVIAQNAVLTLDVTGATIDEVVTQARSASLSAGMRAYYDPDDLNEVIARLDAERGFPARVSCRFNDQRPMIRRAEEEAEPGEVTPELIRQRVAMSTLTWLSPLDNLHTQANIVAENRPGVVALHLQVDLWCMTREQAEAIVRGVEEVAVEAAFDPAAPTKVLKPTAQPG